LAEYKIGVIGIAGKWSTEALADAVEARTGHRLVIEMGEVTLDLERQRLLFHEQDLCQLDALIVKKISACYDPNTLDRLELLRVAEQAGVRVFSGAVNILRLIDRLSCTVTLRNAGIPMPATRVTEDIGAAVAAVEAFGGGWYSWVVNILAVMPGCRRTMPGTRPYTVAAAMPRIPRRMRS